MTLLCNYGEKMIDAFLFEGQAFPDFSEGVHLVPWEGDSLDDLSGGTSQRTNTTQQTAQIDYQLRQILSSGKEQYENADRLDYGQVGVEFQLSYYVAFRGPTSTTDAIYRSSVNPPEPYENGFDLFIEAGDHEASFVGALEPWVSEQFWKALRNEPTDPPPGDKYVRLWDGNPRELGSDVTDLISATGSIPVIWTPANEEGDRLTRRNQDAINFGQSQSSADVSVSHVSLHIGNGDSNSQRIAVQQLIQTRVFRHKRSVLFQPRRLAFRIA